MTVKLRSLLFTFYFFRDAFLFVVAACGDKYIKFTVRNEEKYAHGEMRIRNF